MPLFGKGGRTFNPYASDSPAAKRRRLEFVEDVLTASGYPEAAGLLNEAADFVDSTGDQVVPVLGLPSSGSRLPRRIGRSGRGRFSRSMPRFRRRFRQRRTWTQKVGSGVLKLHPTRRFLDPVAQATFSAGDGTTRVLYIAAPVAQLPFDVQGDSMVGPTIWIKAIKLRGRIALDQTTNTLKVRILFLWSNQFADLPAGFSTYGNTTTITTNPAQSSVDLENNLRIFETSAAEEAAQPSAPFVGNASGIDIIDTDYVKVLGGQEFTMSPDKTAPFLNIDLYQPINKKWTDMTDFGQVGTDQNRSHRDGNYYIIMQVFSNTNANNILAAQDIVGTFDIVTYFKNL